MRMFEGEYVWIDVVLMMVDLGDRCGSVVLVI